MIPGPSVLDVCYPWAAVYKADKQGNKVGTAPIFGRSTSPWKLFSAHVSQTRYWDAWSASFTLVRPILTPKERIIDLINEFKGLIAVESPLIIDAGWARALYSDTNLQDQDRIFYGYIDTINCTITPKRVAVTVSCRDSMRFLLENKFSGQVFNTNGEIASSFGWDNTPNRKNVANMLNIKEIEDAVDQSLGGAGANLEKHKIMAWLIYAGSNGACLPGKFVNHGSADIDDIPDPIIETSSRIVSQPLDLTGTIQGMQVMNQFPLQVLKHLGSLEAEPRELFADPDTGRISWRARRLLRSNDPWEYSVLVPFADGTPPNVLKSSLDWSSIGTISEIVVINPNSTDQSVNPALRTSGVINISGRLPDDRFLPDLIGTAFPGFENFTRRTRYIFDDTIYAGDTANAEALINAMFEIWGKDLRAGTFEAQGNAKIRPGHAVTLYNAGYFDGETFRTEAVEHHILAVGPSKGFKTSVAWAETDRRRTEILTATTDAMQAAAPGSYYLGDDASEKGGFNGTIPIDPTANGIQ